MMGMRETDLVAALCSPVWQNRKRTSFSALVKAYLPDMTDVGAVAGINWVNWDRGRGVEAVAVEGSIFGARDSFAIGAA